MEPRNERVLTLDKNPEQLFKAWQQAGKIPPEYHSWQELESTFMNLVRGGLSEKEARTAMGVTYRNVDGQNLLQINQASDGSTRGLNKRAVRVDFNIGAENHLRNREGQPAVDARINEIRTDWNKLSKLEAQQMGLETGKQFHRGHVVAGLKGGSLGNENMWPEHGMRNVLHGKAPRWPISTIEELGIPKNDLETIYERQLQAEGLGMPRISNALAIALDEQMVDPTGRDSYMRNYEAGIAPETALAIQQKLNELEAQGFSRQAIENWSRNQSGTLSQGNAVSQSGPVRQVVPPRNVPIRVQPAGSGRATTRLMPAGASPVLITRPSRSTTLGAKAAAIATREPIPQPAIVKPKPAKPAKPAKPTKPTRINLRLRSAPEDRTLPLARRNAANTLNRIMESTNDVIRINPGEWMPGNQGV